MSSILGLFQATVIVPQIMMLLVLIGGIFGAVKKEDVVERTMIIRGLVILSILLLWGGFFTK